MSVMVSLIVVAALLLVAPHPSCGTVPGFTNSDVPEWFEDCVLLWAYVRGEPYGDILIDKMPFPEGCIGASSDPKWCAGEERVTRCWYPSTLKMGYPGNRDFSPLLLLSIKNLVEKGHLKRFSHYELNERFDQIGRGCNVDPVRIDEYGHAAGEYKVKFMRGILERCTDKVQSCYDYSCDQHSLEYWCEFFVSREYDYPATSVIYKHDKVSGEIIAINRTHPVRHPGRYHSEEL